MDIPGAPRAAEAIGGRGFAAGCFGHHERAPWGVLWSGEPHTPPTVINTATNWSESNVRSQLLVVWPLVRHMLLAHTQPECADGCGEVLIRSNQSAEYAVRALGDLDLDVVQVEGNPRHRVDRPHLGLLLANKLFVRVVAVHFSSRYLLYRHIDLHAAVSLAASWAVSPLCPRWQQGGLGPDIQILINQRIPDVELHIEL
mmetsp:Transcript_30738/g.89432  ORF Transcript_30738/g.89432 Transcript_30738/m.89432 type:complete len:200 (+) Transcript_30738:1032-1631(+)